VWTLSPELWLLLKHSDSRSKLCCCSGFVYISDTTAITIRSSFALWPLDLSSCCQEASVSCIQLLTQQLGAYIQGTSPHSGVSCCMCACASDLCFMTDLWYHYCETTHKPGPELTGTFCHSFPTGRKRDWKELSCHSHWLQLL
jgi:hypothetical protein